MTIGTIFQFGNDIVEVRIVGVNCWFKTSQYNAAFVPIDSLRLSDVGILKEFPSLRNVEKSKRKEIAIQKFKDKIKELRTEDERMEYIINDLKKFGYKPLYQQKAGWRPKKL